MMERVAQGEQKLSFFVTRPRDAIQHSTSTSHPPHPAPFQRRQPDRRPSSVCACPKTSLPPPFFLLVRTSVTARAPPLRQPSSAAFAAPTYYIHQGAHLLFNLSRKGLNERSYTIALDAAEKID